MASYIKTPCKHCPYRNDVKPFLHPERGEQLAYIAQNQYNEFFCHKTTEYDEDAVDHETGNEGKMVATQQSKLCAGFLTLMAAELGENHMPKGFTPSYANVYTDSFEMAQAYEKDEK